MTIGKQITALTPGAQNFILIRAWQRTNITAADREKRKFVKVMIADTHALRGGSRGGELIPPRSQFSKIDRRSTIERTRNRVSYATPPLRFTVRTENETKFSTTRGRPFAAATNERAESLIFDLTDYPGKSRMVAHCQRGEKHEGDRSRS